MLFFFSFNKCTTSTSSCSSLVSFIRNQRSSLKHLPHRNEDNSSSIISATNSSKPGINSSPIENNIIFHRISPQKQISTTTTTTITTDKLSGKSSTMKTTTTCPTLIFSSKTIDSVQKFTNNNKLTLHKAKVTSDEMLRNSKFDEKNKCSR